MKIVVLLFFFVFCSSFVFAAPVIDDVQGTFVDGQSVVVDGSGFGVKSPVSPLIWDDFENGAVDTVMTSTGFWGLSSGNPSLLLPRFSSEYNRENSLLNAKVHLTGSQDYFYRDNIPFNGLVYVNFWAQLDNGDNRIDDNDEDPTGWQVKHWAMGNGFGPGGDNYPDFTDGFQFWEDGRQKHANWFYWGDGSGEPPVYLPNWNLDVWTHVETKVEMGTPNNYDATFEYWMNGRKYIDYTNLRMLRTYDDLFDSLRFGWFCGNGCDYSEQYFDNIYADNTTARIELCNQSVWDDSIERHCEIQIPHTTWNNNQIQFLVNQGSFTSDDVWLFVVDANGGVSNGFSIIFGSSTEPITEPTIYGVSDNTLSDGQSITISGAGFGVKSPVKPLVWDTLDNQPAYAGLSVGDVIPDKHRGCVDCPWYSNGPNVLAADDYYIVVADADPRVPHTNYFTVPTRGAFYLGELGGAQPSKLYVNWWFRSSTADLYGASANSFKFTRINSDDSGTWHNGGRCYSAWWESALAYPYPPEECGLDSAVRSSFNVWEATTVQANTWHHMEEYADSSALTSAKIDVLFDSKLLMSSPEFCIFEGYSCNYLKVGVEPNYPSDFLNDHFDFDDFYVDITPARIELCDVSDWSLKEQNGAHCEIQIPHTTWNDNTIQFTVNTGSFTQQEIDAGLFLFVVEADGAVSEGYELNQAPVTSPTIYGLSSEELVDGQSVSISGAGFGVSPISNILLYERFDDGNPNVPISGSPDIGSWNIMSPQIPYYSSDAHSGFLSSSYSADGGFHSQFYRFIPHDKNKFFWSFWFKYSMDVVEQQVKLIQLWGDCQESGIQGTCASPDYAPGFMSGGSAGTSWNTYIITDGRTHTAQTTSMISQNVWHRVDLTLEQSDPGVANGRVIMKIDGQNYFVRNDFITRDNMRFWNRANFFYGFTNQATSNTVTNFIDDAYFASSWARIELCDSNIYDSTTHCELQIPSVWDFNLISIDVNQGSFTSTDVLFLFVIDENGLASDGFGPLIFEDGGVSVPGDLDGNGVVNLRDLDAVLTLRDLLVLGRALLS